MLMHPMYFFNVQFYALLKASSDESQKNILDHEKHLYGAKMNNIQPNTRLNVVNTNLTLGTADPH